MGTVGLTSMGMFGKGTNQVLPITPMNITMSIGTIEKKLELKNGNIYEQEYLNANIAVNHDLIDGGPLMRFIEDLKKLIRDGFELPEIKEQEDLPLHFNTEQIAKENSNKVLLS
jgi:pyruvate/2-oxoglutarate dehydrogenase complex dihydrolipoamide acyltransferase (E2) component